MRWRLILEEFGPELKYIKGEKNVEADALSRLEMDNSIDTVNPTECFGYDDDNLPANLYPVRYCDIAKAQRKELKLVEKLTTHESYTEVTFRGGDNDHKLICHNGKIVIPKELQERTVDWYHEMLCHPGEARTELTIRQHFDWKGLREPPSLRHAKDARHAKMPK